MPITAHIGGAESVGLVFEGVELAKSLAESSGWYSSEPAFSFTGSVLSPMTQRLLAQGLVAEVAMIVTVKDSNQVLRCYFPTWSGAEYRVRLMEVLSQMECEVGTRYHQAQYDAATELRFQIEHAPWAQA